MYNFRSFKLFKNTLFYKIMSYFVLEHKMLILPIDICSKYICVYSRANILHMH